MYHIFFIHWMSKKLRKLWDFFVHNRVILNYYTSNGLLSISPVLLFRLSLPTECQNILCFRANFRVLYPLYDYQSCNAEWNQLKNHDFLVILYFMQIPYWGGSSFELCSNIGLLRLIAIDELIDLYSMARGMCPLLAVLHSVEVRS